MVFSYFDYEKNKNNIAEKELQLLKNLNINNSNLLVNKNLVGSGGTLQDLAFNNTADFKEQKGELDLEDKLNTQKYLNSLNANYDDQQKGELQSIFHQVKSLNSLIKGVFAAPLLDDTFF